MDDYVDEATIAEMSAALEAELAEHDFNFVFDYPQFDGIHNTAELFRDIDLNYPELELPNGTPARFYFDDDGKPCSPDAVVDISKPAETEVMLETEGFLPMPTLIREPPQTNAELNECLPSTSFSVSNEVIPTSPQALVDIEAEIEDESVPNSYSPPQHMKRIRLPKPITTIPPGCTKKECPIDSILSPITVRPAPSSCLEMKRKVPHPGKLQTYEPKRSKCKLKNIMALQTNYFNPQNSFPFAKRPKMKDVIAARRMHLYVDFDI